MLRKMQQQEDISSKNVDVLFPSHDDFNRLQNNTITSEETNNVGDNTQGSRDNKVISIPKWQITLTSKDCTIKKHVRGWQICPKDSRANDVESNQIPERSSKISNMGTISQVDTNFEHTQTANVEICCNRDNLEDLFDEENENESNHGSIILKEYLKLLTTEDARIGLILKILTKAMNEHKVFIICGIFPVVRKPLAKRGWIEKRAIRKMLSMSPDLNEGGTEPIEKLLRNPPHMIWYTNKKAAAIRTDEKIIVNKFAGCYFTSKVDMCNNLENVSWFYEPGVSNIQFPRCYNVYQPAQVEEFVQDFYITACMGILKWFIFLASIAGPNAVWSPNGTIPTTAILFALERCVEYISIRTHEDIDREDYRATSSSDWNKFLEWYERIVNGNEVLEENNKINIDVRKVHNVPTALELLKFTASILKKMIDYRPQSRIDGMRDVWILKPGDKSLGRGIVLMNSLKDILNRINQTAKESMQYVVQKYIERPLLVYKTKVDVRQWFLITSTQPLVVWMYKDILLRFASKDFTLDNFHESIHLCNTTVQLKYRKSLRMNAHIPRELHWNLQSFKEYLKATDRESAWEKVIKPGIKQNLIGALLASQENMVNRKNSFQLYGADFVIMDDLTVWLIEINTNPRLHPPSSVVTGKLYPEVIEDTMKDRRKDKKAVRGKFECIFKQRNPFYGNVLGQGTSLGIRGKALLTTPQSTKKLSTAF